MRNEDIVGNCEYLIAFWDGQSNGTKHSIGLAKKTNKLLETINYTKDSLINNLF